MEEAGVYVARGFGICTVLAGMRLFSAPNGELALQQGIYSVVAPTKVA